MLPDPACLQRRDSIMETLHVVCPPPRALFVDVTFDFVKKDSAGQNKGATTAGASTGGAVKNSTLSTSVQASFGCMTTSGSKEARASMTSHCVNYLATESLSSQQLRDHIASVQLDPQTVTEKSLAAAVAKELLRLDPSIDGDMKDPVTVEKASPSIMKIDLPYSALGTTGLFLLPVDEDRTTTFDSAMMQFISWDLIINNNNHKRGDEGDAKQCKSNRLTTNTREPQKVTDDQILSALATWNARPLPKPSSRSSPTPNPKDCNETAASTTTSANSLLVTKRKIKGEMAAFGGRRKKQNKGLVFDNSDSD